MPKKIIHLKPRKVDYSHRLLYHILCRRGSEIICLFICLDIKVELLAIFYIPIHTKSLRHNHFWFITWIKYVLVIRFHVNIYLKISKAQDKPVLPTFYGVNV